MKQSKGFTLIELVIVIVLLGILAATALPKFANMTGQARTAASQGVAGALGAAVSIAHAQWLADGNSAAAQITLEGTGIEMSTTGWPENDNTAVADGTMTTGKCDAVLGAVLNNPPAGITASGATADQCTFSDGNGNTFTYDKTNGAVT